jgi:hypothetical protein
MFTDSQKLGFGGVGLGSIALKLRGMVNTHSIPINFLAVTIVAMVR